MRFISLLSAILSLAASARGAAPTLVATIPLGSAINAVAANPVTNRVYVAGTLSNSVVILDGPTNTISATVPINIGGAPVFLTVNKTRNQYVVASASSAGVFDGLTNEPLVAISPNPFVVGNTAFTGMLINETANKMYSNPGGGVFVTDLTSGVVSTFAVPFLKPGEICTVHSLAYNAALNWLYAVTQCQLASAVVFVFDGTTGATLQTVDLGASIPFGADVVEMVLNPKSNKLYLANYGGLGINTQAPIPPSIEVYNAATLAHLASVPGVVGPLAVDSVLNAVYGISAVGLGGAMIDGSTDTFNSTFALGFGVDGTGDMPIAVNEATNMVYYLNTAGGSISVFQGSLPAPGTFSVSGQLSGSGAAGVTIQVQGGTTFTTVTDASGVFTATGLPPGAYIVTPVTPGLFYSPASQSINITTANTSGVNFAALKTPVTIQSLTPSPYSTIASGVTTNGVVTLDQPAPVGGVLVNLSSSNPKLVKIASTVSVPSGNATASFAIQASGVNTPTQVNISAVYNGPLAASSSSATTTVTDSPGDSLHVQSVTWSKSTQVLKVNATSTIASAIVTVFNASGNAPLGTMTSLGSGSFTFQTAIASVASVNIRSNLGGSTGQGVTVVP